MWNCTKVRFLWVRRHISSVMGKQREGNKTVLPALQVLDCLLQSTPEGPLVKTEPLYWWPDVVRIPTLMRLIPEESGYNNGTANFYDVNMGLSHRFDKKNHLYVNGYFSTDRFSFDPEVSYRYQNINTSVRYRSVLKEHTNMLMSATYDRYNYHTLDSTNIGMSYDMSFDLQQASLKADFTTNPGEHIPRLQRKYHLLYTHARFFMPLDNRSLVIPETLQREQAIETALYLGNTWEITPRFSVEAGIRYGFYSTDQG